MSILFGVICGLVGFWFVNDFLGLDPLQSIPSDKKEKGRAKNGVAVNQAVAGTRPNISGSAVAKKTKSKPKVIVRSVKKDKNAAVRKSKAVVKVKTANKDDLMRIAGVGPKIAKFMKKNGISSFQALAKYDNVKLATMLKKEGVRARKDDPESWKEQAQLAVKGDWENLRKYQEKQKSERKGDVKTAA